MNRILSLLAIAGVAATVSACGTPPQRVEGPWCANYNFSNDGVESDCSFYSIEECRTQIVAGNRGFCGLNPRYQGPSGPSRKRKAVS